MSGQQPAPSEKNITKITRGVIDLFQGRGNHAGSFTCALNAASTTITHPNVTISSQILLFPTTAHGATEFVSGNMYVSAKAQGTFTVAHTNSATATRTFDYAICS